MERIEHRACFGGWQDVYRHHSTTLGCDMQFAVYLPPQAETQKLPVLYWLSGLTCTEQNFITKAGAQRYAAEHGVIIVAPDTYFEAISFGGNVIVVQSEDPTDPDIVAATIFDPAGL
ncbi:MAG: alpha/beta hydrolase-fold protein, partial [Lysobacteraceae bacterium]